MRPLQGYIAANVTNRISNVAIYKKSRTQYQSIKHSNIILFTCILTIPYTYCTPDLQLFSDKVL